MEPYGEPDDNKHPNYIRIRRLSTDNKKSVWLGRRRSDGQEVVLKYIKADPQHRIQIMRQVANHYQLFHDYIVCLHTVTYYSRYIVLEMEAMHGGTLDDLMKRNSQGLEEHVAYWYFAQITLAVHYCHCKAICIRDITLENILLSEKPSSSTPLPLAKFYNFEWSKDESNDSKAHSKVGTLSYQAPEVVLTQGDSSYYGDTADAWSLGVVLYYLIYGKHPFNPEGNLNLISLPKCIEAGDYMFPEDRTDVSDQTKALISELLTLDPNARLTVGRIFHDARFKNRLGEAVTYDLVKSQNNEEVRSYVEMQIEKARRLFHEELDWPWWLEATNSDRTQQMR